MLLGAASSQNLQAIDLRGNLQKCADKSASPHWMTAFPVHTPKPDFHRPEFFQSLKSTT